MKTCLCFTVTAALGLILCGSWDVTAQEGGEWGTVKGRIVSEGAEMKFLDLGANTAKDDCLKANKGKPPMNEKWVVDPKNKGLRDTFVWLGNLEKPHAKKPFPTHPKLQKLDNEKVELDQPACCFMPHAIALRDGQTLVVKNSAIFPHNFKYTGNPATKNAGENFLLPPGASRDVVLESDRLAVKMECNIHPWMNGWIRVFNHPYFAVTGNDGTFEFKDAPAGKFRLLVWHGSAGWKDGAKGKEGEPIEIKAGGVTDLGTISFPPPAN